jgi:hypothetical protein
MEIVEVPVRANGKLLTCFLDIEDFDRLAGRKLSLGSHGYVQMWSKPHVMLLHRWVLDLQRGDRRIGDHVNGDPLDNRRANLRIVTASGSSQNVSGRGKSKHRGVHPAPSGKWYALAKYQGRTYRLGTFDTEEEAAVAADAKRRELMPDYAGPRVLPSMAGKDMRTAADRVVARKRAADIREWGRLNGFEVADAGRISSALQRAYLESLSAACASP